MRELCVLDPGLLTTVQDLGRPGLAHLGVPRSGALDGPAHALANRLVGNPETAATLETTLTGMSFRTATAMTLAVTGAACAVTVAGRHAAWGAPVTVPAGSVVVVGPATRGTRSYVALRGGVAVEPELGSRSTDLLGGLGPAPLRAGDRLRIADPAGEPVGTDIAGAPTPVPAELVLLPGPRTDWCDDPASLDGLACRVTGESNRIGLRLDCSPVRRRPGEVATEGTVLGAVQLPPNGRPIVLLADHATTGGYPVVAVVRPDDLPGCAQLRPGDAVTLRLAC